MRFSTLALLLSLTTLATQLQAVQVPVASYSLSGADGGFYADSTGVELTDGFDATTVWGNPTIDFMPLVGWQNNNSTIQFNFAGTVNVGALEVWFADSDGAAGVAMPSAVTLSTPGGYSQSFPVIDPPGAGTTVPITISGLNISTDNITLTATRTQQWTMLSEVRFFERTVPEPAGLVLAAVALGLATLRRLP